MCGIYSLRGVINPPLKGGSRASSDTRDYYEKDYYYHEGVVVLFSFYGYILLCKDV